MADDVAHGLVVILKQHPLRGVVGAPTQRRHDGQLPHPPQAPRLLNLQGSGVV